MPYQIDRTDGTVLVTLADGVVDNSTDLQLVGRNVAGYGEQQNENFVKLLENFARADTPPSKPQVGQLWFDKNADKLRPSVFDGVHWRNLSITQVSATEPQGQKEGDLWWDTVNNKLYVFVADGNQHVLVGPESILGFGKTKWETTKLTDTSAGEHPVSIGYVDGSAYMVMADTAFEIDQAVTPLTGFTRIGEGLTSKGTNVDGVTSGTTRFFGTAGDADRLGGRLASTWANRNDNEIITGTYSFQNDGGITIGDTLELSLKVINANEPSIFAEFGDQLNLGVNYSGSGFDKTTIYLKEKSVLPYANNEVSLGSPSRNFRNVYATDIYANFIGTLAGSMVGTTTGANRGPLQDSSGATVIDPDTGLSYTINVGNSQATNGLTVVDVDATTTAPIVPTSAGTLRGRFEGSAAFVDYGVYTNQNNVLAGSNTYNGTSVFNGSSTHTALTSTNVNLSVGRIGRGAITSPNPDPNTTIGDLLIDRVTINESKIQDSDIRAGTITNGTVIDGADIGQNAPAIQVKAQKFVDAVGAEATRISNDGQFLQNSTTNLVTERAIKEYVDTTFQSTGQDIQFYLDTKDMTTADVGTQLTRLAPPENFKEGTTARILGSYYYGDLGTDSSGQPFFVKKYGTTVQRGIGYIGGRTVTRAIGAVQGLINKKSATQGYEFQLSATGSITTDTQTHNPNTNQGDFTQKLGNGTIDGWYVFPNAPLNGDQADEFSTDAVQGAKVVVVRNGLVETYSSSDSILQLVVGNVTFTRAATSYWNGTVSLAGYAVAVQAYAFDRTSRTSSAAWVYRGNI